MDNCIKWLEKYSYDFEVNTIGENYFYGVDPVHFPCVVVLFPFGTGYNIQSEKKMLKYINRFNYTVVSSGYTNHGSWYIVTTAAAAASYNLYRSYMDRSIKQFELVQHNYYTGRLHLDNLNKTTRGIMNKWENRYKKAVKGVKTA